MEITVEHLGAVQFEIRARQHTIMCDQPEANGGFDEGMTPPELMLASLGSCAGYYAAQYLRKKGLATEGTRVRVTAGKVMGPARLENFKIEVSLPIVVGNEHRKGVEEAVITSCRVRLRPILMTSLATIIGMVPMALKLGTGSEQYAPLARAIIGGLTVSVVLTVFIVPAAYLLAYGKRDQQLATAPPAGTAE